MVEVHPHASWFGQPVSEIEKLTNSRIAFVTRLGEGLLPDDHIVLQEGDLIHVVVLKSDVAKVEKAYATALLEKP